MDSKVDDRSSTAKAMSKVTAVTTIGLMMAIPALIGYFLDQWLGTVALFMILGVVIGLVCGVWQLFQLVKDQPPVDMSKMIEVKDEEDEEGSLSDDDSWNDES